MWNKLELVGVGRFFRLIDEFLTIEFNRDLWQPGYLWLLTFSVKPFEFGNVFFI